MVDGSTYLCGLVAGAGIGTSVAFLVVRRIVSEGINAKRENTRLAFLLDDLQRAELGYRQAADTRGEADSVTHTAWERMRAAGEVARCFLYHRKRRPA